jgi:hypothetical protein
VNENSSFLGIAIYRRFRFHVRLVVMCAPFSFPSSITSRSVMSDDFVIVKSVDDRLGESKILNAVVLMHSKPVIQLCMQYEIASEMFSLLFNIS